MEGDALLALLDAAGMIVSALDERGRFVELGAGWSTWLGWQPDAVLGRDYLSFVHDDDRVSVKQLLQRASAGSAALPGGVEHRVRHADGSDRWLALIACVRRPNGLLAVSRDVSAERAARAELALLHARHCALLETAPGYVTVLDRHGVIVTMNHTYQGLTLEQVIGSHVLNWLFPAVRAPFQAALDAVLRGERKVTLETEGVGRDGGPAWYRSCLTPIEVDGAIVGIAVFADDVTAQHRARQQLEREQQLAALGRVSAAVAHDYNTLFTAVLCSVDAARMVAEEPEALREELATIETAVTAAAQLTQHLRRVPRGQVESGERLDLSAGLRDLAPLLERVAGSMIQLRLDLAPGPLYAALSAADLNQLMLNLVFNSREAMPNGGEVRVTLTVDDRGSGSWGVLRVSDTGPGIPHELLEHLFEPYFSTKERGSGFGLATCYGIAVAAGGEIHASSEPGGGATIEIRVPLHTAAHAEAEPSTQLPGGRTKATLLVVEDSHELRATLRRHFERVGYSVLIGCDANDALEVLGRHPGDVDLVISDVVMNGSSGISLFETLQRERPALPALAITGHAPEHDLGWLRDHGVPVLRKPFSARELEQRVRELLA